MVVAARGDALFGLADLGLGKCEACQRLAMHLSMFDVVMMLTCVRAGALADVR